MGSPLPTQTRKIGKHDYRVTQLRFESWLELQSIVFQVLGPSVAEILPPLIAAKMRGEAGLLDVQMDRIGSAIYQLSSKATAAVQKRILDLLAEGTQCDGHVLGPREMPAHWPRNMAELGPFVAFALEVQFADFIDGLVSLAPTTTVQAPGDQSPNT